MEDKDKPTKDDPSFWSEYYDAKPSEEFDKKLEKEQRGVCIFLLIALAVIILFYAFS